MNTPMDQIDLQQALTPLWLTLQVALFATLVAGVAGIATGSFMARRRFPGHAFADAIFVLPMVLPPTVLGYYLIVLIGRNGPIGRWFEQVFGITFMFSVKGAVIAAAIVSFPLLYKAARAAFEDVNPNLEHAARTLGSTEFEVFVRVSLPLAMRGITAGLMLTFARAMGEFGATLMIAGNLPGKTQTLSIAVYDAVQSGNDAQAWLLTGIISGVCIVVLVISGQLLRPKH